MPHLPSSAGLAERIVRVLDLAAGHAEETDLDTPELALADEIRALYRQYKSKSDFTSAARRARVEVVTRMIDDGAMSK